MTFEETQKYMSIEEFEAKATLFIYQNRIKFKIDKKESQRIWYVCFDKNCSFAIRVRYSPKKNNYYIQYKNLAYSCDNTTSSTKTRPNNFLFKHGFAHAETKTTDSNIRKSLQY